MPGWFWENGRVEKGNRRIYFIFYPYQSGSWCSLWHFITEVFCALILWGWFILDLVLMWLMINTMINFRMKMRFQMLWNTGWWMLTNSRLAWMNMLVMFFVHPHLAYRRRGCSPYLESWVQVIEFFKLQIKNRLCLVSRLQVCTWAFYLGRRSRVGAVTLEQKVLMKANLAKLDA